MWNVIGPWADPRFTDVALLEAIAAESDTAAVGILTNPNLTGEPFRRTLARAHLVAETIAEATARRLLSHRPPGEQVDLVLATAARSRAGASSLVAELHPAAALDLYTRTQTGRFRGATALAESIRHNVYAVAYRAHLDPDAVRELTLRVIDHDHRQTGRALGSLAASCQSEEELLALADLFDVPGVGATEHLVHELALATFGYDDVTAAWAERSDLGTLVAASDMRLPPATLRNLQVRDPGLQPMLDRLRQDNLGLVHEDPAPDILATLEQTLSQITTEADMVRFHGWVNEAAARLRRTLQAPGKALSGLDGEQINTLAADLGEQTSSRLSKVVLFTHREAQIRPSLLVNMAVSALSPKAYASIRAKLTTLDDAARQQHRHWCALYGIDIPVDTDLENSDLETASSQFVLRHNSRTSTRNWRCNHTETLLRELPSALHWREMVTQCQAADALQTAADTVADVARAVARVAPGNPSADRFHELFGDPLAGLD